MICALSLIISFLFSLGMMHIALVYVIVASNYSTVLLLFFQLGHLQLLTTANSGINLLSEQIHGCWEERWEEGIVGEFVMNMYILLYLKWVTNKDLLYSK